MSTRQRIELGTAGGNIAGNIEVLLPQLAAKGAEVAVVGNEIHERLKTLRRISAEFRTDTSEKLEVVAFDRSADAIDELLSQLASHGDEVNAVALAIKGYTNQLRTVHAQHLHLTDPDSAKLIVAPHVNNGLGSAPFNTGTAIDAVALDTTNTDPVPRPAGDGTV